MFFVVFSEGETPFVNLDLAVPFWSFSLVFYKLPFSFVYRAFGLLLFLVSFSLLPEIKNSKNVSAVIKPE